MHDNVPDRERRRADELQTGDWVVFGDKIGAGDLQEVLFAYRWDGYVTVVLRQDGYQRPLIEMFDGSASVAVALPREVAAEYSRAVDNGDPHASIPAGVVGQHLAGRAA